MLKVRTLVLFFFELKLRVLFNSVLSCVDKSFELVLEQKFYLVLIFMLVLVEINLSIKKKVANRI